MPQKAYVIDQMISAKAIAARIEGLAREITAHYAGTDKLIVVGLLRGSFVFIADLVREIDLPVEVDFLEASSYGDGMQSSREVRILKDLRGEIAGRDVLVVEDIVDTGFTLHHVRHLLESRNPARLEVCALLDKPTRREVDIRREMDRLYHSRMNLSWVTALILRNETATCPISARCASPGRIRHELHDMADPRKTLATEPAIHAHGAAGVGGDCGLSGHRGVRICVRLARLADGQ